MIKFIVKNSNIAGTIDATPSKSYTHRAIICAALASGVSTIINPLISDDTEATLTACEALGAEILDKNEERIVIKGTGGKLKAKNTTINCNESGSTLLFLIPLAALADKEIIFTGKTGLATRPIDDLLNALAQLGVKSTYASEDKKLPMKICGTGSLTGGKIAIRGNVSSQFISGLLFALPLAINDSEIVITTEVESKDYIEITLDVLKKFGIKVEHSRDLIEFKIKGKQQYKSCEYTVEGDYSSAAFMLVAGAIAGNGVTINNLNKNSKQGDKRIVDLLKEMGAKINVEENSVSVERSELRAVPIDAKDIPDLIPILAIAATQANFTTVIKNVGRLRLKESDRLQGVLNIITSLRGTAKIENNSIAIRCRYYGKV